MRAPRSNSKGPNSNGPNPNGPNPNGPNPNGPNSNGPSASDARPERRQRGFEPASGLLKNRLRAASEKRGFAVAQLLTGWDAIAGAALAPITRPVKVSYPRDGLGATLTLLVSPAHGPQVQMAVPQLIDRVNAVYGYRAISRIALTQTAATGFAEGQTPFAAAPKNPTPPDPAKLAAAKAQLAPIADADLRGVLETLARNILTRKTLKEGSKT